jgi:hypothetical protein
VDLPKQIHLTACKVMSSRANFFILNKLAFVKNRTADDGDPETAGR